MTERGILKGTVHEEGTLKGYVWYSGGDDDGEAWLDMNGTKGWKVSCGWRGGENEGMGGDHGVVGHLTLWFMVIYSCLSIYPSRRRAGGRIYQAGPQII